MRELLEQQRRVVRRDLEALMELQGSDGAVPLVGNSKRKWLEENAKAADLRPSEATLAALDKAFKPGVTLGERYAAPMMARLGL